MWNWDTSTYPILYFICQAVLRISANQSPPVQRDCNQSAVFLCLAGCGWWRCLVPPPAASRSKNAKWTFSGSLKLLVTGGQWEWSWSLGTKHWLYTLSLQSQLNKTLGYVMYGCLNMAAVALLSIFFSSSTDASIQIYELAANYLPKWTS